MATIMLNGNKHVLDGEKNIAQLLTDLKVPATGVAVVINDNIVARDKHDAQHIRDGDRIEIIRAIGGG